MIAAPSHFKLGLLTLITLVAIGAGAVVLGVNRRPVDVFHTYFDESVHGLDPGAHVKFRGVRIGRVTRIDLAPDGRHVDVTLAIDRRRAQQLRLANEPRARTQINSMGITGVKVVDIQITDDPETLPPLSFTPADPHLRARPSLISGLERGLETARRRLPETLDKLDKLLDSARLFADTSRAAVNDVGNVARSIANAKLPAHATKTMSAIDALTRDLRAKEGPISEVRRAADAVVDLGRETRESQGELVETLRDIREAAHSIRELADALEREPDMLLKGREQ